MTYLESKDHNSHDFDNELATNIIFVDNNLNNYQSLISDLDNSAVYLIDSQQNGIEQITEVLEKYSNLNSIQILSHGDIGLLQLGNTNLSGANLDSYQDDLAVWGKALLPDGDLLFYGCNVGADAAFVNEVASLTSADIAASNDLTGNVNLGGDWDLEVATGKIETTSLSFTDYQDVFLSFNITYDDNTTLAQKQAFELAAKMWSNVIGDNVTVNIHVNMAKNSDLPANTLGGAIPFFLQGTSYTNFRNALINDKTTSDDTTATNSLQTGAAWSTWMGNNVGTNSLQNLSTVAMSRANAKALGLIGANNSTLDGLIVLNDLAGTGVGWQYNYSSSTVGTSNFDFTTVAMHEIGHILGFFSVVDGTTTTNANDYTLLGQAATSLDLFRYINQNSRNLCMGYSHLSLNKGLTSLAGMSYGTLTSLMGDGYQGSHWANPANAGLMDPVAELNVRRSLGNTDLQALDAIGWNKIASTKSVSTLTTEANSIASTKGNVNRNSEINTLLANWSWARRGSTTTLTQSGNLTQFLGQQGFFTIGSFNEKFDLTSLTSTENSSKATTNLNFTFWNEFLTQINYFGDVEFNNNFDLDDLREIKEKQNDRTSVENPLSIDDAAEDKFLYINDLEILNNLADWSFSQELSQFSLDDLKELVKPVMLSVDKMYE